MSMTQPPSPKHLLDVKRCITNMSTAPYISYNINAEKYKILKHQ